MELEEVAPGFVKMAHEIVWCSVATVDRKGRPRSRVLHPVWEWDGETLTGWIGTGPTALKQAHIKHSSFVSANYWAANQDTCVAECHAEWAFDDETCRKVWDLYVSSPPPLGYDPSIIPGWDAPENPGFAVLKLSPWWLRVFPGTMLLSQQGEVLVWKKQS